MKLRAVGLAVPQPECGEAAATRSVGERANGVRRT